MKADPPLIAHLGAHKHINAGDRYLLYCTRFVFSTILGACAWRLFDSTDVVDGEYLTSLAPCSALLIGGGGLFLPGSARGSPTGWQCSITPLEFSELRIPIVVFGVGSNLFFGQRLSSRARESIKDLVRRSVYFGVRHYSDMRSFSKGFEQERDKLALSLCPSLSPPEFDCKRGNAVAFVLAYDRPRMRFQSVDAEERAIKQLGNIARNLARKEHKKVHFFNHVPVDRHLTEKVIDAGGLKAIECRQIDLFGKKVSDIAAAYLQADTVFSMRGHGQMIALGLGLRVISLQTHEKIGALCRDLMLSGTCVDIRAGITDIGAIKTAYDRAQTIDFAARARLARAQVTEAASFACQAAQLERA